MRDPQARLGALRELVAVEGIDGLLITHLPNVRYLTGFSGSAALLAVLPDAALLVSDFRYATQAAEECDPAVEVVIHRRHVWDAMRDLLAERLAPGARLGVERETIGFREWERVVAWAWTVLPVRRLVERLREVKDPSEVEWIQRAIQVAEEAWAALLPTIRVGEMEGAIAGRLERELRERGSEKHPFEIIVASGPRAALPHARTSRRRVERGDLLLLDFGATIGGYVSDLTRTVVVGAPATARQRDVYEAVRAAQQAARNGIQAGMTGAAADALARGVLAARGLADLFGHALGHGIGLEVHEAPRLAETAPEPLPAGAVVTVEPGVYLPGWGGVRLEDDMWLRAEGVVSLSPGAPPLLELR